MGKESRVAKMPLGSLFVRTFDSHCSFCYNDCRKSLGGRYNRKIHHRWADRLTLWTCRGLLSDCRRWWTRRTAYHRHLGSATPAIFKRASAGSVCQSANHRQVEQLSCRYWPTGGWNVWSPDKANGCGGGNNRADENHRSNGVGQADE